MAQHAVVNLSGWTQQEKNLLAAAAYSLAVEYDFSEDAPLVDMTGVIAVKRHRGDANRCWRQEQLEQRVSRIVLAATGLLESSPMPESA